MRESRGGENKHFSVCRKLEHALTRDDPCFLRLQYYLSTLFLTVESARQSIKMQVAALI